MKNNHAGHTATVWMVSSQDFYVGPKGPTYSHVFYSNESDAIREELELCDAGHLNVSRKQMNMSQLTRNIKINTGDSYHLYQFISTQGKVKYGVTRL